MTGVGTIAAWTGPALVVAIVSRVVTGGVEAPLFVLAVSAAPLLALLAGSASRAAPSPFALAVGLVTVVCVLAAGFRAINDLGHVLGVETGATLGSTVALVLVATVWPSRDGVAAAALTLGAGALLIAVIALGVATAAAPWTAWSRVASRVAFELGPRSSWPREGVQALEPVTLTFTEPHRVTAATAGVFRVSEHDRGAVVVREWRLAAGDSMMLRPGDALAIPVGARVRFEPGKRLPGAPASGVAWAERAGAPRARLIASWLGLVITLAGGAVAILRPAAALSRAAALMAPATVLGVVWAATCWGVYAVDLAPELSIGAPPAALLAHLPPLVAAEPWRSRLLAAIVVALVALLLASAAALCRPVEELSDVGTRRLDAPTRRRGLASALWIAVVTAAAAGSVVVTDGWSLLLQGAGLAAATLLGPLLATGDATGFARARVAGMVTGATLFVAVAAAAHWRTPAVAALAQYPALIAAPAAWLVAALARRKVAAATRH